MCGKSATPSSPTYASTTSGSTGGTGATTLPASPLTAGLYNQVLQSGSNLAQTPFNPATLGQLTPWTPEQQAAAEQIYSLGSTAGVFNPAQIQQIMSPYIQDVVTATQNQFNNQNAIQGNQLIGQAIQSGNIFGGDRAGIAAAQLAGQQQTAQAPVIAGLYQSGYDQALQQSNLLTQMGLQGAQTAFGGASLFPGYQQQALNLAQQNAIQQSAYPFQLANWQAGVAGGIGPLTGTTGTTNYNVASYQTPPAPNPYTQGLGLATTALSAVPAFVKRGGLIGYDDGGRIPLARVINDVMPHRQGGGYVSQGGGLAPAQALPLMHVMLPGSGRSSTGTGTSTVPSAPATPYSALGDFITAAAKAWPSIKQYFHPTALGTAERTSTSGDFAAPAAVASSDDSDWLTPAPSAGLYSKRGGLIPHRQGGGGGIGTPYDAIMVGGKPGAASGWMGAPHVAPAQPLGLMQVNLPDTSRQFGSGSSSSSQSSPLSGIGGLLKAIGSVSFQAGGDVDDPEEGAPYDVAGEPVASGRMTWFNPRPYTYNDPNTGRTWTDTSAARLGEGAHASGLPITTPGIALSTRENLGQPVVAVLPDGRRVLTTQTDIGPPGVVDLNAALASRAYPGGPGTVPGGNVRVERPDASDMQTLAFNTVADADPDNPATAALNTAAANRARTAQAGLQPGITTIPGFAPRPRTKLEEWAQSPLLAAGTAMLGSRSPYFGEGLAKGIEGARGAIEERYKADTEKDKPTQKIVLPDGSIAFLAPGTGKLVNTGLKDPRKPGKTLQVDVPGQGKQWIEERTPGQWYFLGTNKPYTGLTEEQKTAAATELVSGTPATKDNVTALSKDLSPAEVNTRLYDHNLFDYSTGTPGVVQKGFALPAPADIPAQGKYPGLSAEALRDKTANFMLNGPSALTNPRGTRGDIAEGATKENAAIRNYAAAMFRSLGIDSNEVAERWRGNKGYLRWMMNPRGGLSVGSIGTVIDHLDTLEQIYKATAPGTPQPVLNAILAKVSALTGSPVTTLDYASKIVAAEIIKGLGVAGGGGQHEREEAATGYGPRLTPDQFFGPMGSKTQIQHLMAGQLNTALRMGPEFGVTPDVIKRMAGERAWNVLHPAETTTTPPPRPPGVPEDAVWNPATKRWER